MEVSQRKESSLSIMLERERDMIITNVRLFLFILVEKKKKCETIMNLILEFFVFPLTC